MKAKSWLLSAVVAAIVIFLVVRFVGPLPIFTLMGCQIIQPEYTISTYEEKSSPVFEEWKAIIKDWEESPIQSNADACYDEMQGLITSWHNISPPEKYKDYHLWVGKAMEYEAEAFRIIAGCPPNKLDDVRDLTFRLWVLKDEALLKAEAAIPKK